MSACSEIEKIALTHRGFVREVNEDRYYMECLDGQTLLLAVVDGMGGGPAGSAAAEIMREALTEYPATPPNPDQTMAQLLVEEGRITPDEAWTHPYVHLLDQCVGCSNL